MSTQINSNNGNPGIFGLLGIVFVVLKLTHVIDWSWWWVTFPFWGGLVLVLGLAAIGFLGAFVILGIEVILEKHRFKKEREINRLKYQKKISQPAQRTK